MGSNFLMSFASCFRWFGGACFWGREMGWNGKKLHLCLEEHLYSIATWNKSETGNLKNTENALLQQKLSRRLEPALPWGNSSPWAISTAPGRWANAIATRAKPLGWRGTRPWEQCRGCRSPQGDPSLPGNRPSRQGRRAMPSSPPRGHADVKTKPGRRRHRAAPAAQLVSGEQN